MALSIISMLKEVKKFVVTKARSWDLWRWFFLMELADLYIQNKFDKFICVSIGWMLLCRIKKGEALSWIKRMQLCVTYVQDLLIRFLVKLTVWKLHKAQADSYLVFKAVSICSMLLFTIEVIVCART